MSFNLKNHLDEIVYLKSIKSLLSWDQEVIMPSQGVDFRGEQMAIIEKILHEKILDPRLAEFANSPSEDPIETRHRYLLKDQIDKHNVPLDFSLALTKHTCKTIESWKEAREKNDFSLLSSDLKQMIEMQKKLADFIKKKKSRYDALLSFYDRDLTYQELQRLFENLKNELKKIVVHQEYPKRKYIPIPASIDHQKKICRKLVDMICESARIDASTHPFCDMIGPYDIRVTTRYNEEDVQEAIYSTLHELGHALYDKQLSHQLAFPLNEALSLTVHESQSKLFETCVGGSEEFLKFLYNLLKETLPDFDLTHDQFSSSRKAIQKNPIRIESDEFSYPLHIIFRTKLEHDLIEGIISVDELPKKFREYQKELLGIDVTSDKEGCLQDIHWAAGYFGYFPTYLTGCMYAQDQYEILQTLGLTENISSKNLKPIQNWLKNHIHQNSSLYPLNQLIEKSTHRSLSGDRYLNYLKKRFL